jgi:hypothetical protein
MASLVDNFCMVGSPFLRGTAAFRDAMEKR